MDYCAINPAQRAMSFGTVALSSSPEPGTSGVVAAISMAMDTTEASLSADPVRFTEIKSLDGDCVFISPCSCKSFRPCQYDGVGSGDLIYFIDGYLSPDKNARPFDRFVYNLKDGSMAPFAAEIPEDKLQAPDGMLMHPTWLFPPE